MKYFIIALIVLLLIIFGVSYFMFYALFYRPKRSKKIPKEYMDTPHYKVSRAGMKIMDTLECKDLYITSRDGLKLHAYFYPTCENPKKILLGIHGYKSYARPEYGPYVEFYRSLGYSLLIPDDRAHAPSEGKYVGFGIMDRLDCVDWAKYIVEEFGKESDILVQGVSMGAATVLAASCEDDLPKQVRGIIADCGFTSAWDILAYQIKKVGHLPTYPFLYICEKIYKHRVGEDFSTYSAINGVKKSKVPILFVQGEKDQMVPNFMVHELYEACTSKKKLMISKDAGHAESIAFNPEEYHQNIIDFFNIKQ